MEQRAWRLGSLNEKEMYKNTIPLFLKNINYFENVQFINVTYNTLKLIYSGNFMAKTHIFMDKNLPS
jgi:hypothetical protein